MAKVILEDARHRRFVYLSILWCRIRAQGLATKNRERKKYLGQRILKIEAEQNELLAEWKQEASLNTTINHEYESDKGLVPADSTPTGEPPAFPTQ